MSIASEIVSGEICGECHISFTKPHGYPVVCRECGKYITDDELKDSDFQRAIFPVDRALPTQENTK